MGAFCVFGVSKAVCLARAAKATPVFETIETNLKRYFTVSEWGAPRCVSGPAFRNHDQGGKDQPRTGLASILPRLDFGRPIASARHEDHGAAPQAGQGRQTGAAHGAARSGLVRVSAGRWR